MTELIEYRVRPVTRYIITRFESAASASGDTEASGDIAGQSQHKGEHDNADVAYEIAYALAKHDHELKGWPPGDERIQYPRHPNATAAVPAE